MNSVIYNPIIMRELIRKIRQPRTFVILFVVLGAALFVICPNYYSIVKGFYLNLINFETISGRGIFYSLVNLSCFLALPIAMMGSASIVKERESESLDLLLTTPLKHRAIIWGKCAASFLYALLILSSLIPFFSICFILGGIGPHEVIQCVLILASFYLLAAMLGIMVSLFSSNSATAGRVSIMMLIFTLFAPIAFRVLLEIFVLKNNRDIGFGVEFFLNPFIILAAMQNGTASVGAQVSSILMNAPGYICATVLTVLSILIFIFVTFIFGYGSGLFSNRFSWSQFRSCTKKTVAKSSNERELDSFFKEKHYLIYQKENINVNSKFLSRERNVVIGSCIISLILSWMMLIVSPLTEVTLTVTYVISCLFGFLIAGLFTPVAPSFTFWVERNRNTWPLLRTTTLRSLDIVLGKALSNVRQVSIPLFTIFLTFFFSSIVIFHWIGKPPDHYYLLEMLFISVFFLGCMYLYTTVGIHFSSASRKDSNFPYRKTISVVLAHLLLPTVFLIPMLEFMGVKKIAKLQDILVLIAPISLLSVTQWDFGTYAAISIHTFFLFSIGTTFLWAAVAEIKKRD